jgi:hypothetical protein
MKVKNATSVIDSISSSSNDDNSCVLTAISTAFRIDPDNAYRIFKQLGRKKHDGCTNAQVRKAIEIVSASKNKYVTYTSQKNNPSLDTLAKKLKKGKYLVNCVNHITYLKDGIYFDDYIYFATRYPHVFRPVNRDYLSVVGYWQILDERPNVL